MGRRRLFWRLYATYLLVVVLCAGAIGWYATSAARNLYLDESERDLHVRGELVARDVTGLLAPDQGAALQSVVTEIGGAAATRVTVIDPSGVVLADSDVADPATLENHADRPEVRQALAGNVGRAIHFSETLGVDMMYVASPLKDDDGTVRAVVRTAVPLTSVNEALRTTYRHIVEIAVAVALVAALIGLVVSRRISRQMRELERGAERFAAGDLGHKLQVPAVEEFGAVAESLNRMASQLDETIRTITAQRNERDALLTSMVEGLLAVDPAERVITLNEAAAVLLGVSPAEAEGSPLHEVVRNPGLQRFVTDTLASDVPTEGEIMLKSNDPQATRYLQAHGSPLRGREGEALGAVVVLNEVTRMRRLETVRRDFVANVSHELRTPVTSIKGFAETLLDGAIDDRREAERFLGIIVSQADRLNAIVEDLLAVSRLEREDEGDEPALEEVRLADVMGRARDLCEPLAAAAGVQLVVDCPPDLTVTANAALLEQALVNLVDNAIKYSPVDASVEVVASVNADEVVLSVTDHGAGIAREHLPRLFERFYRVDKARSRDLGGTGLGLAIVKHIAQVHGGRVSVESVPGAGSTFRIHLPR